MDAGTLVSLQDPRHARADAVPEDSGQRAPAGARILARWVQDEGRASGWPRGNTGPRPRYRWLAGNGHADVDGDEWAIDWQWPRRSGRAGTMAASRESPEQFQGRRS